MGEQLSGKINAIIEQYKIQLIILTAEELAYKPLINKWSKKEILGHLIDSAYHNHHRFLKAAYMQNLIFDGYDQEDWVLKNNYQDRDSNKIISLLISVNQHLAHLISTLKDEVLTKKTENHNFDQICMKSVEKGKPSSLAYLIEDYIYHLEHHLNQVLE